MKTLKELPYSEEHRVVDQAIKRVRLMDPDLEFELPREELIIVGLCKLVDDLRDDLYDMKKEIEELKQFNNTFASK